MTVIWNSPPISREKFEAERRVVSERMARSVQSYAQIYPNIGEDQAWELTRATAESEKELVEIRRKAAD